MPFYLRTGKRLPKRTTEIAIQFRRPPLQIFKRVSPTAIAPNLLIVNVQPDEGISVRFEAKLPGTRMQLAPVMMNFRYGSAFGGRSPKPTRRCCSTRCSAIRRCSRATIRRSVVGADHADTRGVERRREVSIPTYEAGEWGPPEADAMMARDGRRWRTL